MNTRTTNEENMPGQSFKIESLAFRLQTHAEIIYRSMEPNDRFYLQIVRDNTDFRNLADDISYKLICLLNQRPLDLDKFIKECKECFGLAYLNAEANHIVKLLEKYHFLFKFYSDNLDNLETIQQIFNGYFSAKAKELPSKSEIALFSSQAQAVEDFCTNTYSFSSSNPRGPFEEIFDYREFTNSQLNFFNEFNALRVEGIRTPNPIHSANHQKPLIFSSPLRSGTFVATPSEEWLSPEHSPQRVSSSDEMLAESPERPFSQQPEMFAPTALRKPTPIRAVSSPMSQFSNGLFIQHHEDRMEIDLDRCSSKSKKGYR